MRFAVLQCPNLHVRNSRFLEKPLDRVGELLHEGNVTRVIVKDEGGKTLLEIPATVGVLGVVLAPWLAALGVVAALVTKCKIIVERRE